MSREAHTGRKRKPRRQETASEYSFTVLFEPAAEGGYLVTCPALPGLVTEGDTLREARAMARDAIRAYLESLRKDGEPIPRDLKSLLTAKAGRRMLTEEYAPFRNRIYYAVLVFVLSAAWFLRKRTGLA